MGKIIWMGALSQNCNEDSDEWYILEVDIQYPENLHNFHDDLPFLLDRIKIEKVEILVANLHDKKIHYAYKKLKTSIKSWISI